MLQLWPWFLVIWVMWLSGPLDMPLYCHVGLLGRFNFLRYFAALKVFRCISFIFYILYFFVPDLLRCGRQLIILGSRNRTCDISAPRDYIPHIYLSLSDSLGHSHTHHPIDALASSHTHTHRHTRTQAR